MKRDNTQAIGDQQANPLQGGFVGLISWNEQSLRNRFGGGLNISVIQGRIVNIDECLVL
jgi:hypothetical protein